MSHGRIAVLGLLLLLLTACGGGGGGGIALGTPDYSPPGGGGSSGSGSGGSVLSGASGTNVAALTVDGGISNTTSFPNAPYTSVRVCVPGSTSQCVTVDHVLVDTGSSGLRLMTTALLGLTDVLPPVNGGNQVYGECASFVSSALWGSVRSADVYVGGEVAGHIPVQVIGDPAFNAPSSCGDGGLSLSDDSDSTGFKGIIGIGHFVHDCDSYCVTTADNGNYFLCTPGAVDSCGSSVASLGVQVVNPVTQFSSDNNGTEMVLQAVPLEGQSTASGNLIFGIGTRSNNALGNATPLFVDDVGFESTTYLGSTYSSYVDSGTSVLQVQDSSLMPCDAFTDGYDFACPTSPLTGTAILSGSNAGVDAIAQFTIENATTLFDDNPGANAFNDLGDSPAGSSYFVWGEPFFYGRPIYTAIAGQGVAGYGTAAFVAF